MPKKFMLEDPNIPCMSPSQFVHEHPINSAKVLRWACMQVSVAGAAVLLLPGAGHSQCPASCETGGNTQNDPKHQPFRRAPSTPAQTYLRKSSSCKQWRHVEGETAEEMWGWRGGHGRRHSMYKECIPRDWLQDDS